MKVNVEINNQSSRAVKPKFILYKKRSFFAQGRRRLHTSNIQKEKMKYIAPCCRETVTQVISIPPELPSSNLNCSIIKVEYRLKVSHSFFPLRHLSIGLATAFPHHTVGKGHFKTSSSSPPI